MYPERRKRNIQLISDEERVQQRLHGTDTWGQLVEDDEDDFEDLEEGEEILLESGEEEIEVEIDEWLENEEYEEEHDELKEGEEEEDVEHMVDEYVNDSKSIKSTNEKQQQQVAASSIFLIDGKPFIVKEQTKRPTFHESHVRVTTYIDKNVHQIIKMLLEQNQIESITKLVNDSLKDYLMNRYHNDN